MYSPTTLLSKTRLGPYELQNRMVMAPMTRNRAGTGNAPQRMNVEYYAQRATAGLIITEATQVSEQGVGYPSTPGIHTGEQVEGWRAITEAVHDRGGRIFLQLWHVGRISHPSLQPDGELPVAPSAVKPAGEAMTYEGLEPFVEPRALETEEVSGIVEQFRRGAENALEAGFDGVEIHGANGYLLDQFVRDNTNLRDDRYGGSVENRARLHLEITEAVVGVWGAERVGMRLSPSGTFNDMHDSDPETTFGHLTRELDRFGMAYLHVVEPNHHDVQNGEQAVYSGQLGKLFEGPIMVNGDYDLDSAERVIEEGQADLVSFGKLFLANPDLPERFRKDTALNEPDRESFYGGDHRGYIDYPSLDEDAA